MPARSASAAGTPPARRSARPAPAARRRARRRSAPPSRGSDSAPTRSRSSTASVAVATASHVAPPRSAASAHSPHPVAVAVGLDDRAELGPGAELRRRAVAQLRSTAPRSTIARDPLERIVAAQRARPPGSDSITSPATPTRAPTPLGGDRGPARAWASTAAQAAANGSSPRASSAPICPRGRRRCRRSPGAGLSSDVDRDPPAPSATIVSSPFSTTIAAGARRSLARLREPVRRDLGRLAAEQAPELAGVRRQHRRRARARAAAPSSVPSALRPSASISSGASIRGDQLAGEARRSLGAAEPRAEDDAAARSARSRTGAAAAGAEAAADVRRGRSTSPRSASPRGSARATRAADRRVAGAGADRGPRRHADGAPVSPREPPTTSTSPELNFVDSAPRRGGSVEHGRLDRARATGLARARRPGSRSARRRAARCATCRARSSGRPWRRGR